MQQNQLRNKTREFNDMSRYSSNIKVNRFIMHQQKLFQNIRERSCHLKQQYYKIYWNRTNKNVQYPYKEKYKTAQMKR